MPRGERLKRFFSSLPLCSLLPDCSNTKEPVESKVVEITTISRDPIFEGILKENFEGKEVEIKHADKVPESIEGKVEVIGLPKSVIVVSETDTIKRRAKAPAKFGQYKIQDSSYLEGVKKRSEAAKRVEKRDELTEEAFKKVVEEQLANGFANQEVEVINIDREEGAGVRAKQTDLWLPKPKRAFLDGPKDTKSQKADKEKPFRKQHSAPALHFTETKTEQAFVELAEVKKPAEQALADLPDARKPDSQTFVDLPGVRKPAKRDQLRPVKIQKDELEQQKIINEILSVTKLAADNEAATKPELGPEARAEVKPSARAPTTARPSVRADTQLPCVVDTSGLLEGWQAHSSLRTLPASSAEVHAAGRTKQERATDEKTLRQSSAGQEKSPRWVKTSPRSVSDTDLMLGRPNIRGSQADSILEDTLSLQENGASERTLESLESDLIFQEIGQAIKERPDVARQADALYVFLIKKKGHLVKKWILDLTSSPVSLRSSGPAAQLLRPADCTIVADDRDFFLLASGDMSPQKAITLGKLKVRGNFMLLQKLHTIL